jgi:hypothetical protein
MSIRYLLCNFVACEQKTVHLVTVWFPFRQKISNVLYRSFEGESAVWLQGTAKDVEYLVGKRVIARLFEMQVQLVRGVHVCVEDWGKW